MKKISFLIYIAFIYQFSFAQGDSLVLQDILNYKNLAEIEDIGVQKVVSASRSSKSISDLPVTIYVVTREEIIANNYVTLTDVLKNVPGMIVSQPGGAELGETFQMRGMLGNNYTKILVNNMPIKSSVLEGLPIGAQLPVRQAERIEIIYGPASALYGADATVGVINIITKKPTSGTFATADINLSGNFMNFSVGGKAGKNNNILEFSIFGGLKQIEHIDVFQDEDLYRPLSYLDQTYPAIEIDGQSYLFSELSQEQIELLGLSNIFYDNFEGTADSIPIGEIPHKSYYTGFELKYKNFNLSIHNMYRKDHSSLGRTPFLFKYNNSQNYIANNTSAITIGYNKQFKKIYNTTNITFLNSYLDNNSNFGTSYIPNGEKMYIFNNSNDIFIEELITYNHKALEIVGGFKTQFSFDIPTTNYLKDPYDGFTFDDFGDISTQISISQDYESFGKNPYAFFETGVFLQTYFNFEKLIIMGGIRADYNSLFEEREFFVEFSEDSIFVDTMALPLPNGVDSTKIFENISYASSLSPRIAVLYKINNYTSIRASYGKAFKPPAGNQIFSSIAYPEVIGTDTGYLYAFVPNITLKPEYFSSFEIGVRHQFFNKKIQLDASYYYNKTENVITAKYVNPKMLGFEGAINNHSNPARIYANRADAFSSQHGVSFFALFNNLHQKTNLHVQISGTFVIKAKELLSNGDEIDYLRGSPRYFGKIKTGLNITEKIYVNILNYWASRSYRQFLPKADYYLNDYNKINGYFTTDIYTGFRAHQNLNIYLKITNFGNKQYAGIDATGTDVDLRYNPQLGSRWTLGLTFILN